MKIFIIPSLVTMVLAVNCCEQTKLPEVHAIGGKAAHPYEAIAKGQGWLSSLKRGEDMVRKLAAMNSDDLSKVDISAYRGEQAAFVGGCAPPGGTDDLLIESGFYLRVVPPSGKDLRPHSAWWEVMVCGTILQVLPKNRIIVIEVEEEGWKTIQTG